MGFSPPSLPIGPFHNLSAEELRGDKTWWRIYEDSFPASQREPQAVILESILRGAGMAFRARHDGVTCGLATTHLLKDPAAVFLVYLAVARGARNRGAGRELFELAWHCGATRLRAQGLQPLGLIWEVDPPQPTAKDAEARQRRIEFFQRRGGVLLQRPYLQPPVGGVTAVPMRLMFRPAKGEDVPTWESITAMVRSIYCEKYGATNGIDRAILDKLLTEKG